MNLSNAVKYSAKHLAPAIGISAETTAGDTCYRISDNGAGFDMQHAHSFGYSSACMLREEFEGTGVGLAIVHRESHVTAAAFGRKPNPERVRHSNSTLPEGDTHG